MKKTLALFLAFITILGLLLAGCGEKTTTSTTTQPTTTAPVSKTTTTAPSASPTSTTAKPASPSSDKYGGVFRQSMNGGPSTPIGYPCEATPDSYIAAYPALETLIRIKRDGTIVPVLATSWKIAEDGKSLTLSLRKGVKFHDGSDFNAEVCKWNLDLEIAAKRVLDWSSVDVVDDYTVRINFPVYRNTIFTNLFGGTTQQISKASFEKNGLDYTRWHPVGTGPFVFVEYQRDAKLTYKRNPSYWNTGLPYLDGVQWTVIPDETVRKLAFQRGDLHALNASTSGLTIKELQKAGYSMLTFPGGTFLLIPCSTVAESPWSNVKVRLAASYALNREALATVLGFNFASPAYQLYPNDAQTTIPNLIKTQFDQAKAKALLADAGYPAGFKTNMHNFAQNVLPEWSSAVTAQLTDVGITVNPDFPTMGKFQSMATSGWNDGLMNAAFMNSMINANSQLSSYFKGYFYGSMRRPPGLIEGIDASLASKNPDPQLMQAVIQVINDDMTVVPYLQETVAVFYQNGVHYDAAKDYGWSGFYGEEAWLEPKSR